MRNVMGSPLNFLTITVCLIGLGATPADDSPSSADVAMISSGGLGASISDEIAGEIDQLISQLGSPDYATRQQSTARLSEIGIPAFSKIRKAYLESDDLEVRLRIEKVVHAAFFDFHVYNRNAFLGIRQSLVPFTHDDDERISEGHIGIEVRSILANTAADDAGIAAKDVIIALDGELLTGTGQAAVLEFGESIRLRGPGTVLRLTFLRSEEELELEVILRARPKKYYGPNQGAVTKMSEEAQRGFNIWWPENFHTASADQPISDPRTLPPIPQPETP